MAATPVHQNDGAVCRAGVRAPVVDMQFMAAQRLPGLDRFPGKRHAKALRQHGAVSMPRG
ncbi:MAG: hypothetical protein WCT47_01500 [Betaproteobacteria bacterium]